MSHARELGFAIKQVSSNPETKQKLQEELGISAFELEKLYAGRLFLTASDLRKVANVCGASIDELLDVDAKEYNSHIVSCASGFTDRENREMILDLIDAYIDAKETLYRGKV